MVVVVYEVILYYFIDSFNNTWFAQLHFWEFRVQNKILASFQLKIISNYVLEIVFHSIINNLNYYDV